jgi:hypothetical protein
MRFTVHGGIVYREQLIESLNHDAGIPGRGEQSASFSVRAIYDLEPISYRWSYEAQKCSHLFAPPTYLVDGLVGASGRWVIEESQHLGCQFAEYPLDAFIYRFVRSKTELP